jgi:hypothetical protein
MNALLRTSLIGATTLFLLALPASAQVPAKYPSEEQLHLMQKQLETVENNIRAVEAQIAVIRGEISELMALYFETGELKYKSMISDRNATVARLQHRLATLNRIAQELRARLAEAIGGYVEHEVDSEPTAPTGGSVFTAPSTPKKASGWSSLNRETKPDSKKKG